MSQDQTTSKREPRLPITPSGVFMKQVVERHYGLARAIMVVLSSDLLRREAIRRAKEIALGGQ